MLPIFKIMVTLLGLAGIWWLTEKWLKRRTIFIMHLRTLSSGQGPFGGNATQNPVARHKLFFYGPFTCHHFQRGLLQDGSPEVLALPRLAGWDYTNATLTTASTSKVGI